MAVGITLIVISLLFSAFFSGMEIAFVSANKVYLELEKEEDTYIAKLITIITDNSPKFISTMLLGNSIALVVYGYYMGELIMRLFFPEYIGMADSSIYVIFVQTAISTLVILLTAEFIPKVFFQIYADRLLKALILPAWIFYILFYVFTSLITGVSNLILKYITKKGEETDDKILNIRSLRYYLSERIDRSVDVEQQQGVSEVEIFRNALDFAEAKVRDIAIPRTEITAMSIDDTPDNLRKLFIETGLSKILIYKDSIDNIVGYVYSFELFRERENIKSIVRPIKNVPESMLIKNVLALFTREKKSIAVVLDEYGGTHGIVTVEDIIEELFGDIQDEHDENSPVKKDGLIEEKISENEYKFSARLEIDYLNKVYKLGLVESDNYETLAGLIGSKEGDILQKGDVVEIDDYQYTIIEASGNKIETVIVKRINNKNKDD